MKQLKPHKVVVSLPIEIDMNELLEGFTFNTTIKDIRKNIGAYLREEMKHYKAIPGEEIILPDNADIINNLSEWDLVSYSDE